MTRATWQCIVLAALILAAPAAAHDHWIARDRLTDPLTREWCCGENDCRPEAVRETAQGFVTQGGDTVPFARVIWRSPDGQWWRCRAPSGRTRCLIGPPPGS